MHGVLASLAGPAPLRATLAPISRFAILVPVCKNLAGAASHPPDSMSGSGGTAGKRSALAGSPFSVSPGVGQRLRDKVASLRPRRGTEPPAPGALSRARAARQALRPYPSVQAPLWLSAKLRGLSKAKPATAA
jgi:hypothetical protein